MTVSESNPDAPVDPEKGAAGKGSRRRSLFVSPFREKVLYAYYTVSILVLSAVTLSGLIIEYMEVRDQCHCQE